jgi:NADH-quinone oxidoreductase subunit H
VLAVVTTGGALSPNGEGSLRLDRLIDAQAGWSGMRWIGILQPLALLLWLSCTSFVLRGLEAQQTLVGQVTRLNCALLGAALFMGGWQGPFVDRVAWLGVTYTSAKVLCFTFAWTWIAASLPRRALLRHTEVTWQLYVPLSALNLLITAIVVAVGSQ